MSGCAYGAFPHFYVYPDDETGTIMNAQISFLVSIGLFFHHIHAGGSEERDGMSIN